MIRIPDVPQLQGARINAPTAATQQVSTGAANAPNAALGSLAQAIAGVGEHFQGIADETQRLENGRMILTARQKLADDYSALRLQLENDPDPQSRIEKTRAFFQQSQGMADDPTYPPQVRENLRDFHNEFASRQNITATADAAALTHKRATIAFQNQFKSAKASGIRSDLDQSLAVAQESGVILPEESEQYIQDFDRSQTGTVLDLAIRQDPQLVLDDIEQPDFFQRMNGFTPEDLPRIRSAAQASAQRIRTEEMDIIEAALEQGELKPQDLEAALYLTPKDVARVKKAMVKVDAPSSEIHGKAWDLLLNNRRDFQDPAISDRDYADNWNDLRSEVIEMIPKGYRGDITAELQYRSPANRQVAKTKPVRNSDKQELKSIGLDRISRARSAGLFGNVGDDADAATREKAFRRAEELRIEVSRYIEGTPDVGIEQVSEFTDGLITGDRVKTSARDLQNFVPGGAQRLRSLPDFAPENGEASDALLPPRQQLENFLK